MIHISYKDHVTNEEVWPGVRQVPEGSGEEGKMEKTGCKIICGAPTTLAVKGLMMMMKRSRPLTVSRFWVRRKHVHPFPKLVHAVIHTSPVLPSATSFLCTDFGHRFCFEYLPCRTKPAFREGFVPVRKTQSHCMSLLLQFSGTDYRLRGVT